MASKKQSTKGTGSVAALRTGKSGKSGGASITWKDVKPWLVLIVVFLSFRTFGLQAYRIPSGSMIPTLLIGDWLFVNNLVFGPNIPFTDINLPGYAEPKRGDVVVFKSPTQVDQPEDPNPTLVKRCVAVAGDTIFMRAGVLHVNGMPQPQGFPFTDNIKGDGTYVSQLFEWQKAFELRGSHFGEPPAQPALDDWGPLVVPPKHLFMLGDNRYDSKDGRYWGFVPRENVRGRPLFVYYSYRDDSDRPWPAITDIRWGRLGTIIR